ncbi:MAG: VanZ family protein [Spirochaetaceae bacterium]|nr:VanZ family protein [Spirochaetaceae bacterium]
MMLDEGSRTGRGVFRFILKIPAFLICIAIWLLSSQSILPQPKGILGFDKLQHLAAYLALAFAVVLWFPPERRRLWTGLFAGLIASGYGIIDELHQYFVPGRDCNVWDWFADVLGSAIGAGIGVVVMAVIVQRKKKCTMSGDV